MGTRQLLSIIQGHVDAAHMTQIMKAFFAYHTAVSRAYSLVFAVLFGGAAVVAVVAVIVYGRRAGQ